MPTPLAPLPPPMDWLDPDEIEDALSEAHSLARGLLQLVGQSSISMTHPIAEQIRKASKLEGQFADAYRHHQSREQRRPLLFLAWWVFGMAIGAGGLAVLS